MKSKIFTFLLVSKAIGINALVASFRYTVNYFCNHKSPDSILIENKTHGCYTFLSILLTGYEHSNTNKQDFLVSQNYPNPFSSETYINIYVQESDLFTLSVCDLSGRVVSFFQDDAPNTCLRLKP
jgi:hypothetical protein